MKRILTIFSAALFLSLSLAACSTGNQANTSLPESGLQSGNEAFADDTTTPPSAPSTEAGADNAPVAEFSEDASNGETFEATSETLAASPSAATPNAAVPGSAVPSVPAATAAAPDSNLPAGITATIKLSGATVEFTGAGVNVSGTTVTVTDKGSYIVSGTLNAGQIQIAADDSDDVELILNGVNITADKNAAIYAATADNFTLRIADGTQNYVTDTAGYAFADTAAEEPAAAIFSKCDLTVTGSGSLVVNGKFKHGIATKDDLDITNGNITVNSVQECIRGKDSLTIMAGTFNLSSAQGDCIQSTNETDAEKGRILIKGGSYTLNAYHDGIQAAADMRIDAGDFTIATGKQAAGAAADESFKGVKASGNLVINGGTFNIVSADDSVHCNGDITITGGELTLQSGDDGIHSDTTLTINGGVIDVKKSYEGIEATNVVINKGTISVAAQDDGINGAGGMDSSAATSPPGRMADNFRGSTGTITINGGTITISAAGSGSGDGLDSNGSLAIAGGSITFITPTNARDYEPLDHDGQFSMTGGEVIINGTNYDATTIGSATSKGVQGGGNAGGMGGRRGR